MSGVPVRGVCSSSWERCWDVGGIVTNGGKENMFEKKPNRFVDKSGLFVCVVNVCMCTRTHVHVCWDVYVAE